MGGDIVITKQVLLLIGSISSIMVAAAGLFIWFLKVAFSKGKTYQLFETLVGRVVKIEENLDFKFNKNDKLHKEHKETLSQHNTRISILESKNNVTRI